MSRSARAAEFLRAWGDGHAEPHHPGCQQWGADPCDRCVFETFPDPWDALNHAAQIMGWSRHAGQPT